MREKRFQRKGSGIVNKNYQQKGYATEALCAVLYYLFQKGIHRVYAECDPKNISSWKLLEKVGQKKEAHLKQNVYFHKDEKGAPMWKNTFIYAIVDSDYFAR